jgi:alkanesulfonate monooxygenase SsuD/methylene tetrahydromethanopterin reductase-like flavin-dependent oxidoreductase (luciferase family)
MTKRRITVDPVEGRTLMQFGIFTVGDVTPDPTTGMVPTENERIKAVLAIAQKAEEVGLDVFALGEHHNPPFIPRLRRRSSATSPRRRNRSSCPRRRPSSRPMTR